MSPARITASAAPLDLLAALDCARARNNGEPLAADGGAIDANDGTFGPHFAAGELETNGAPASHGRRLKRIPDAGASALRRVPRPRKRHGSFDANDHVRTVVELLDHPHDILNVGLGGMRLHYNDHGYPDLLHCEIDHVSAADRRLTRLDLAEPNQCDLLLWPYQSVNDAVWSASAASTQTEMTVARTPRGSLRLIHTSGRPPGERHVWLRVHGAIFPRQRAPGLSGVIELAQWPAMPTFS